MARGQKLRFFNQDGQQPIAKPGTGYHGSGRLLNDRCTQFDNSPFQSDKIRLKECIEAFPDSSSSPFDGKKAVIEHRVAIIHPSDWDRRVPVAKVPELQTESHHITARSAPFHRVTPSHRNITGPVRLENQVVPVVVEAYPQRAPLNAAPAAIAGGAMLVLILLFVASITLYKMWRGRRELKKEQKRRNAITKEWVMAPVTGGRTSPDELQNKLDNAVKDAKKDAEKRKASRLNFVQDRFGGGSWDFVLDRPSLVHQRSGGM
jgi:hypothetical protein